MYHILSSSAFVGGGEKRCQIIDILHGMTDERTDERTDRRVAVSATRLRDPISVWLNIKVEGTKLSSLAHGTKRQNELYSRFCETFFCE